ncbi:MAG: helix-turn-helix domain-containing protein [Sporichthyaceae bacterium]
MQARLESVEQTRRRITEATMNLHETVGPAATTVAAIAEEAGVTRLTVYRHFPDEDALFAACSAHWRELHPRPDVDEWRAVADPGQRLRLALSETYDWSASAAPMMTKINRDLPSLPPFVGEFLSRDEVLRVSVLARGFGCRGRAAVRLRGVLAHALRVETWESLCIAGGLHRDEAVELMTAAVLAAVPARTA